MVDNSSPRKRPQEEHEENEKDSWRAELFADITKASKKDKDTSVFNVDKSPMIDTEKSDKSRIPTAKTTPKRKDRRTGRGTPAFRGIPEALKKKIDKTATEEEIPIGYLARLLFEFSINEYRNGGFDLTPVLKPFGDTPYPNVIKRSVKGQPSDNAFKMRKVRALVSFRGVTNETKNYLAEIAEEHGVMLGDVARKFPEFGLEKYGSAELK